MKRRTAIRNIVIISAGSAFLPSCRSKEAGGIVLKNFSVKSKQQEMLAALTESIVPKTNNFIGASDLMAHEFVLTMIDDCSSPVEQLQFTEGLKAFDKLSHDKSGQLFTSFTAAQKKGLLAELESKNNIPEAAQNFYETVRRYTLQCFTTSKEYMTTIKNYKIIPGNNFKGCVKIA